MSSRAEVGWRQRDGDRVAPLAIRATCAPSSARSATQGLYLDASAFAALLRELGPSLGLWRAAEVAALRELRFEPPVLDLGCGDGAALSHVLPRIALGVDPDVSTLQRAARRGLYDELMPGRIEALPLGANTVRSVISNSVLEHIPHVDAVLAAIHRVLCPGGQLAFTVPTEMFSSALTIPLAAYTRWRNRSYGHVNLWPLRRWRAHLERAGLELVSARSYLRPALVRVWDVLDLAQQLRIGARGVVAALWHRLPQAWIEWLAARAARLDLSASGSGGGRLIVARKS